MQSCKLFGTSRLAGGFLFIQKKGSLERLPFLWKGFYWHNLLIILFLSVIFRTILYPIGVSGQGYCCTALGRDECVGIKASGSSDILVTKLRRYRCYVYPIRQHFSCDDMTQRIHRHCPPCFLASSSPCIFVLRLTDS